MPDMILMSSRATTTTRARLLTRSPVDNHALSSPLEGRSISCSPSLEMGDVSW